MMAGLFNTEYAYRKYLREMLNSFQEDGDNIQYAEVRPNFMKKNQVSTIQSIYNYRLEFAD